MIKFIVGNQTVTFDVEKIQKLKKIGVAFSGGTDSSLILCLLAKYVPDIEIVPWYGIEFWDLDGLNFVKKAYKKIVINYPNANILPMRYFGIDKEDLIWEEVFFNNYKNKDESNLDFMTVIKRFIIDQYKKEYIDTGLTNVNTFGTLMAPPKDECIKYGFDKYVQPYRWDTTGSEWNMNSVKIWQPLKFVNKKFVAGMFKKEGLIDWLYSDLQHSVPCKKESCFGCFERKWAFSTYDGGLI